MIGVAVGQTNIFFFDANGKQIAGFDIAVTRDLNGVRAALKQTLPDADIRIEGVGDGVMLSGTAATPARRSRPTTRVPAGRRRRPRWSTASRCASRDQVMLKVTVAEVGATSSSNSASILLEVLVEGTAVVSFNTPNSFSATGTAR